MTRYRRLPTATCVMPRPDAVNRHEPVDLSFQRVGEQRLDAAQVPESLFTDGADECDRARRPNIRRVERARDREDDGQAAAVVADARTLEDAPSRVTLTSVPSGKTVSRCALNTRWGRAAGRDARRARCPPCRCAHFAIRRAKRIGVGRSAGGLLERRRGNLAEPHLILNRPRLVGPRGVERARTNGIAASNARRRRRSICAAHTPGDDQNRGRKSTSDDARHMGRRTLHPIG